MFQEVTVFCALKSAVPVLTRHLADYPCACLHVTGKCQLNSANPKQEGLLVHSSLIILLARLCNSICATKVSLRAGQRDGHQKLL